MVTQDELQALSMTGLKTYFDDSFLSTEQITQAVTQTGSINTSVCQLKLETGVQQDSTARLNYENMFFNPRYSKLYFAMRLNSMDSVSMFAGFKYALAAPTWGMTATCAGLYIDGTNDPGVLYFYTANGDPSFPNFQATPITDIDMTRWLIFKIEGNRFSWYSLPYTVPYFDKDVLPGLKQGLIRKWSTVTINGSYLPDDSMHYIMFYIRNHTGADKTLEVQKISYAEVYPD
jgi:hypothetical protein